MKPALSALLQHPLLWRGNQLAQVDDAVASGFACLDRELPGGGWPRSALTELLADAQGIGELHLLLPALKRLAQAGEWIALVAPPHIPYAPAFAGQGIDPARVMVVEAAEDRQRWWAAEQVLRSNSTGALLFWPKAVGDQRVRRLQLAAQEGKTLAFLFASTARAAQPSPAPLRLRLAPSEHHVQIDIFKRRGGAAGAPLRLDVAAEPVVNAPGDRAPGPGRPRAKLDRVTASRLRLHGIHPVGGPQARIWSRALVRADEVRRVPGPDPRGEHALDVS
jgi:hypothetical protein